MKKIAVVTAARSEYGLLKWLMKAVEESPDFELQLIVTGAHLSRSQGYTVDAIRGDGFSIAAEVDAQLDDSSEEAIAASMGRMAEGMAHVFADLKPDCVVVLGDRYELLPICNTAFVMQIPIVHISGGDVTEGAIDDGIRNAITMLAEYHFPATEESAENIRRMRGSDRNVTVAGEPGLEAFRKEAFLTRSELAADLGLDDSKAWVLMTYHAETRRTFEENMASVKNLMDALLEEEAIQIVATYSNADFGGRAINEYLVRLASERTDRLKVIPSLGTKRYLSLLKEAKFVIGNSSSGILEAPAMKKAVINIGDRQKGRYLCSNVISCDAATASIRSAIRKAMTEAVDLSDVDHWGDGHTSDRIMAVLKEKLL